MQLTGPAFLRSNFFLVQKLCFAHLSPTAALLSYALRFARARGRHPSYTGLKAATLASDTERHDRRPEDLATPMDMSMDKLLSRITIDPAICHGKPCVRGLRYPVEVLLELLSSGMTFDEVLGDYEDLEREDLLAVLAFAARLSRTKRLQPVGP